MFFAGGYSHLAQLVIIFLITDLLRYKPLIILLGACGVAIWSIFLWAESLISLQIVEVIYGTYCATEVAYFSYIYAKTDEEHYQVVTSHSRAAIWIGKFVAALSAQLLYQFEVMNVRQLNYLTLISAFTCSSLQAIELISRFYFHSSSFGALLGVFHTES